MDPRVIVVMPAYNSAPALEKTVRDMSNVLATLKTLGQYLLQKLQLMKFDLFGSNL